MILALNLLNDLNRNAILLSTLIKLLFPSTNPLWYEFDSVFLIYGRYSFNVFKNSGYFVYTH